MHSALDGPRAAVPSLAVQLGRVFSVAGGENRHSPRAQTLQKGPPAEGQDIITQTSDLLPSLAGTIGSLEEVEMAPRAALLCARVACSPAILRPWA